MFFETESIEAFVSGSGGFAATTPQGGLPTATVDMGTKGGRPSINFDERSDGLR